MSSALVLLVGIAYIVLSIIFTFTPRLRVVAGLVVGGLLAGVVTSNLRKWLANAFDWMSPTLGKWVGQSAHAVEIALPSALAFILAVIVFVHLRGGKGGKGGAGKAGGGKSGGRGGRLAHIALGCSLLLPIVAGSVGELVRSVA
ncbi:hypothetical protein [Actinoplanes siamensis]|uniref:Uncharacterized protein n=1 Tax=Actinoplanes siamensis TaxID=1223317 RepID=A0A919TP68_9ACTN|nr:hypothetical protein [Actinoplanes siamensis]GIF08873.1 hypothetical protein Asi03nite_64110 [Actinoplanes siamensis]